MKKKAATGRRKSGTKVMKLKGKSRKSARPVTGSLFKGILSFRYTRASLEEYSARRLKSEANLLTA